MSYFCNVDTFKNYHWQKGFLMWPHMPPPPQCCSWGTGDSHWQHEGELETGSGKEELTKIMHSQSVGKFAGTEPNAFTISVDFLSLILIIWRIYNKEWTPCKYSKIGSMKINSLLDSFLEISLIPPHPLCQNDVLSLHCNLSVRHDWHISTSAITLEMHPPHTHIKCPYRLFLKGIFSVAICDCVTHSGRVFQRPAKTIFPCHQRNERN